MTEDEHRPGPDQVAGRHVADPHPDWLRPARERRGAGRRYLLGPGNHALGPGGAIERVEILGLPVVATRRRDLEHRLAVARPVDRPVALGPVKALGAGSRGQAVGQALVVQPGPVGPERRGQRQRRPGRHGAQDDGHRDALPPYPLAPQEHREQREQRQALEVGRLRVVQRGRNSHQGHQWQGGHGPPQRAQVGRGEGHHDRGVEQQDRGTQRDHDQHPLTRSQIRDQDAGQVGHPVADPLPGHRHSQVRDPGHRDPAHSQRGQRSQDHQQDGQEPAPPGHRRAQPGHRQRQHEQAEHASVPLTRGQRGPAQRPVQTQRGKRRHAQQRAVALDVHAAARARWRATHTPWQPATEKRTAPGAAAASSRGRTSTNGCRPCRAAGRSSVSPGARAAT